MSSYSLDLSPAQAPLNCLGSSLSSRILSRLRPRHTRKIEYNNRLHEGDARMTEARDVFQACQHILSHEMHAAIQVGLEGLRIERDRLYKFSDYGGSQRVEEEALSRAEVYRTNAIRVHAMATTARNAARSVPSNLYARGLTSSIHSPHGSNGNAGGSGGSRNSGTQRVSSEHARASTRSNPASLPRTPPYPEEPLQMLQTRAGPIAWVSSMPATGNNILGLDAMGIRGSPQTSYKNGVLRTTPAGSILSLDMSGLIGISSMQRSPTSMRGSPADSVGAYSLGSDGFPRPSRRVPQRRGTIQSTTSVPRSNPSRQGSAQTHSSHASSASGRMHSSRPSSVQTSRSAATHSNHSRPSLDSAKYSGSFHPSHSDDRRGRPAYARAPSSLRTSSVPPENRASPYGIVRVTDSPGRYHH